MKPFIARVVVAYLSVGCCLSCAPTPATPKKQQVDVAPPVVARASADAPSSPPPSEDPDAVYQMRQMLLTEWIDKAKRDCERYRNVDAYLPEREGFLPDEVALVKTRCAEAVEVGLRGDTWVMAMSACATRFAKANGKGTHECRLLPKDVPNVPADLFERHKAGCTASCAAAGAQQIELQKERSQHVHCCDGTVSPSCTYGSIHAGCCSGHQGVCIE